MRSPKAMIVGSRWRRRLALPSALMGLVVFSFTLLGFGAVVYTVALPALVTPALDAAAEAQDASSADQAAPGSDAAGADAENSSANASTQHGTADTNGVAATTGGARLGTLSLSGVGSVNAPAAGSAGTPNGGAQQGGNANNNASSGGSANQGNAGTNANPSPAPEPAPEPTPGPSAEQEQATYAFLAKHAGNLAGYVSEVNACSQAFTNDCLNPSLDVRTARLRETEALEERLIAAWNTAMNYPNISNESAYKPQQDQLIVMYRCLMTYVGTLGSAWTLNVTYADPAQHVDEFMEPVRANQVNGQDRSLLEFQQVYEGFTL